MLTNTERFELHRPSDVGKRSVGTQTSTALGTSDADISEEEKDYRRLVAEKFKVVAEWDYADARQLRIE